MLDLVLPDVVLSDQELYHPTDASVSFRVHLGCIRLLFQIPLLLPQVFLLYLM